MTKENEQKAGIRQADYEELAQRLEYVEGKLVWKRSYANFVGKEAGVTNALGYRRVWLRRRQVSSHRLIFFIHYGWLPENVDHKDGDSTNNRIENLRAATISQNNQNCMVPARNTSGAKGVYWHKQLNKWTASISINKRLTHLGVFDSIFDAACARKSAEQDYYGEFAR